MYRIISNWQCIMMFPKVAIMDLHKKGVFSIPFSEIATPPSEFKVAGKIFLKFAQVLIAGLRGLDLIPESQTLF
ncbi:hypothetical protein ROHU_022386 [Labeo rohita]|uniref:Uncharacterized protein n=1 Tax=Labeo rohita TaxID=84645 RepID=A0A498MTH5_LABRO|nr:hypothetical protein ROHU_022386 [Labeo rohita]